MKSEVAAEETSGGQPKAPLLAKSRQSARKAGLRYVSDQRPGIKRLKAGKGFVYIASSGKRIRDSKTERRIKSLAIPPAWTAVWICPAANGHLQAVGRDARGRKQYRYHPYWSETRNATKFNRMIVFGKALPKIRRCVRRELRKPGLGREKVLAAVVQLLELSALRIGNEEYANHNNSYGLTTIRRQHAKVNGAAVTLDFRGKGGKRQRVKVEHPLLSRIVRKCQELPGQDLFQYLDEDGKVHDITSGDVNDFLSQITGEELTAKDFRTWTGTLLAAAALRKAKPENLRKKSKREIVQAIETVAQQLGNTPAVCKKCYIHPAVFDSYTTGLLEKAFLKKEDFARMKDLRGLRAEENAVINLLKCHLKHAGAGGLKLKLKKSLQNLRKRN